jgi:hypothetical protein
MYKSEYTKIAIEVLGKAKEYLEWLDEANSHISGNGKDSILECESHIAMNEPDNPLYNDAVTQMFGMSLSLHEMRNELLDAMDIVYGTAKHFKLFDADAGEWFHENNSTAEKIFMEALDLECAS